MTETFFRTALLDDRETEIEVEIAVHSWGCSAHMGSMSYAGHPAEGPEVEIGSGGSTVMVEPELRKGLTRRVFRRMLDGSLEWAAYDDWRMHNERARFFGFGSRDLPASMTS